MNITKLPFKRSLSIRQFSTQIPKKVTILGGTGFLGQYITKSFLTNPTTYIQPSSRSRENKYLQSLGKQILPTVSCDITNVDQVKSIVEDSDVVVNLVGVMYEKGNWTMDRVHVGGAENVAKAVQATGGRLIHVSAIGADPNSHLKYLRTKGLGEQAIFASCSKSTILRPSLVFGKEDDFFNRFSQLAKYLPFLPVFGGGHSKFQPVYVWDIAHAVSYIASHPNPFQKIVEAGGPRVYTYRELMELVLEQSNRKRPIISLPWFVGKVQGFFLEKLPPNLFTLTRDQVETLKLDNIVCKVDNVLTLEDLGISPTPAESILYTYLRPQQLTTKNKRIHKMHAQDLDEELNRIREMSKGEPPKFDESSWMNNTPLPKPKTK